MLERLTRQHAKRLRGRFGLGTQTAATLLAVAGDNPERLRNEAALAAPMRGESVASLIALWPIALVRMRSDLRTQAYVERRTREGRTTKEIHRCLKRYIVRELYPLILADLEDTAGFG